MGNSDIKWFLKWMKYNLYLFALLIIVPGVIFAIFTPSEEVLDFAAAGATLLMLVLPTYSFIKLKPNRKKHLMKMYNDFYSTRNAYIVKLYVLNPGQTRLNSMISEDYYDKDTDKFVFPGYRLVEEIKTGGMYEEVFFTNKYGYDDYHLSKTTFIVVVEHDGIEYEAVQVDSIFGKKFKVAIDFNSYSDVIKEVKKMRADKLLDEEKRINYAKEIKRAESVKVQLSVENINQMRDKLSELGLTEYEITSIVEFYDRGIVLNNRIDKQSIRSMAEVTSEIELEMYLIDSSYKLEFNPMDENDKYSMKTREFELLNKLGMVTQEDSYPFYVRVKDITQKENWIIAKQGVGIVLRDNSSPTLDFIKNGFEFEEYVAELLKLNEFYNVKVTSSSGDQGVDIVAETADGVRYGFQTKFYTSSVGNDAVQQIIAGKKFYDLDVGVVLTNSTFTSSAITLAQTDRILLWDKDKLHHLMNAL